ncbi:Glucan endo-1,3-beta-glucosidase [Spatholobus suberectus]|nr:Glucan endo-1,3-beta-glucosidase [Spatholobus suberectus]
MLGWPFLGSNALLQRLHHKFSCVTGNYSSDKLECIDNRAMPPRTLAMFTPNNVGGLNFFDMSLVDDYNVPMLVVSQGGFGNKCTTTGCIGDLNGACPSELKEMSTDEREGVASKRSGKEGKKNVTMEGLIWCIWM